MAVPACGQSSRPEFGLFRMLACYSYARHPPPHDGRLLRDDGQVGTRCGIRLPPALFPFLQRALTDAVGSREFGLGHLHSLADRLDVNWLRPHLLQFELAAPVGQAEFHSFDQVFTESRRFLLRRCFPRHSTALLSDRLRSAAIASSHPRSDPL